MLKLFWHYVLDRAFHKAESDIKKALDPVFDFYGKQQIYLKLWSIDILTILTEQVSQPYVQVGCLLGILL